MDFYKLVSGGGEVSVFMCVTCEWRVCVCAHTCGACAQRTRSYSLCAFVHE